MAGTALRRLLPAASRGAVALLDSARGALETPVRAEVFGAQRFQQHGHSLGEAHDTVIGKPRQPGALPRFFPRLRDNVAVLREAHRYISEQEASGQNISPAGIWLLDNFHIVAAQLQEIHVGLPRRYFHDLPVLVGVHLAGLPRIYGVAWAFVAHTDSAFDEEQLVSFLQAYQQPRPLTLGELWALPTTLRVVLIENLRRLAERVAVVKAAQEVANLWCDTLAAEPLAHTDPVPQALYEELQARGAGRAFALQMAQRLNHSTANAFAPVEGPLRRWLASALPDAAGAHAQAQADQAANNLSVSNAITSLRLLGDSDWRGIVGRTSLLMQSMAQAAAYRAESDDTQDTTLQAIERLARRGGLSEQAVARALLRLISSPAPDSRSAVSAAAAASPRYWLSGPGRATLRLALGLRAPWLPAWSQMRRRVATPAYLVTVALGGLALTAWCVSGPRSHLPTLEWPWVLSAILAAGPAFETVIAVINRLISESVRPQRLPRLALADGIPAEHRVLVVIPSLLTGVSGVAALAGQLERHYLANPQAHAQFALLSDFADADTAHTADDAPLLACAAAALRQLNQRYAKPAQPNASASPPRFLLLHRERRFSVSEQRWIGWERKRGKLEQLIAALAGDAAAASSFIDMAELSHLAAGTPYVVTLDSDTQLPPGSLRQLVGVAAHPLNQPQIDVQRRRVSAGYGILQPRVVTPLAQPGQATPFHWLFAGQSGQDPYSSASSEIYQDLFNEGSFTGKGLLNVQAMHAVLAARLPEGLVLSHDLLEGSIARCGGVSDITLIEDAPMHADVAASRNHRWTRGDWQLLPLLAHAGRFGLRAINRWKMLDNLRRSLVAPMSLLLLVASLAGLGMSPAAAMWLVVAAFGAGPLLGAIAGLAPSRDEIALLHFYRQALAELLRAAGTTLWNAAQLLHNALLAVDAIARALYRMAVSKRGLLQWTTAAAAQASAVHDLPTLLRRHWREPLVAGVLLLGLWAAGTPWPGLSATLCLLWAASPLWIRWASRPYPGASPAAPTEEDRDYLLGVGRDTWRLFEHGVGAQDHDLPPDNVQTQPHTMVAHRTSPTNIGLYLLASACAQRFGWIGRQELLGRAERTLASLGLLARHAGHFFNWYDTQTLQALPPAYVSTVDSGNLCGCLIAVAQACEALAAEPPSDLNALSALAASQRRLAGHAAAVLAIAPGGALHEVLNLPHPLQLMRDDPAAFEQLLQRAGSELAPWMLRPAGAADDAAPALRQATWLVRDHLSSLRSLALDVMPGPALDAAATRRRALALGASCRSLAEEADFAFLFNPRRRLFHIGYRVPDQQLDASYFDLLASEARLASLWAIAKGDVPAAHWAALGRPVYAQGSHAGLRSWSGSMFEYLMPTLLLDEPQGSLLASAAQQALRAQVDHGRGHGVPWGVSESAYAASDHTLAYQYAPQGVPSLALRRAPADELVIAPYATALALLIAPSAAAQNLRRLQALHARDEFGFVEALDFTPERQAGKEPFTPVFTFMAHHQGMSIVALADVLLGGAPRRWAMAEPRLQAVAPLLQERVPREVSRLAEATPAPPTTSADQRHAGIGKLRQITPGASALQPTHLLSNGRYSVALRANGAGWSRCGAAFISRWRDDALRDAYGMFFYLRRSVHGAAVSLTQHPAPDPAAEYGATFHIDRVCFDTHWADLRSHCSVWVSPEDDIELRQIELHNLGGQPIEFELMSAFEVTLAEAQADEAHPAFSNLFVRADWRPADRALYLERQPRLATEQGLHAVHFVAQTDPHVTAMGVQTRRERWLARQHDATQPLARMDAAPEIDCTLVTGLDPVACLSLRLRLPSHGKASLVIATAAAPTRAALEALVDKYRQASIIDRSAMMSATLSGIRRRELRVSAASLAAIQTLSTPLCLLMARPMLHQGTGFARRVLWRFGISGDRPIVLMTISAIEGAGLVRSLVQALKLWAWGGLACDLVVLNDEPASYLMLLHHELAAIQERFVAETGASASPERVCALHILRVTDIAPEERTTLHALARVHLNADGRPLAEHVQDLVEWHDAAMNERAAQHTTPLPSLPATVQDAAPGGDFSDDGAQFRFEASAVLRPSSPWINVLANPDFGTQVSEAGTGYTWAGNSRMHQLTAWSNDAVSNPSAEWLLLHDLRTGEVWNVAAGAGGVAAAYSVQHGQGSTCIEHFRGSLEVRATWCVDPLVPVKQLAVEITNHGAQPRRLRLISMAEWMLGAIRADRQTVQTAHSSAAPHVLLATQHDHQHGFGGATAFMAWRGDERNRGADGSASDEWTCDRREFFDARGHLVLPDHLGQRDGSGLDPCAALAVTVTLAAGASSKRTLLLGHAATPQAARSLAQAATSIDPQARLRSVHAHWDQLLGVVTVQTPDPLFDALVNRWLLYQTVACRLWARAGFYQAGGAFGFRDQLQDAMALAAVAPQMLRSQLLLAASRQFVEGDVQHWWHEPSGAGVRTHFSDDLLWLAHATVHYLARTEDHAVLDEEVPFLAGAPVPPGAEDAYYIATPSSHAATLYEHCARAIDRSLAVGAHGLPLMGSGDWNDGMNRVGHEGRGESVWLGWFLCRLVQDFAPIAAARGEGVRADRWLNAACGWQQALQESAWDGEWFVRAFFDDGTPLGSKRNAECRIDVIAQAWAVLSGATTLDRQRTAMAAVERLLVDPVAGLVRLLDPPLVHALPSAGYIQAYPPGVRENGGQYSHAGVWALMAQAQLGHNDAAWRLFKMISPAHRSRDLEQSAVYGLEPYAVAGDIYSQPPYVGRGGWSWYTGAAAWLHRAAIESIVGLRLHGERVCFSPKLPSHWPLITLTLRRAACVHEFTLCAADHAAGIEEAARRGALPMPVDAWRLLPAGPALQRHLLIVPAPIVHSAVAELAPLDR